MLKHTKKPCSPQLGKRKPSVLIDEYENEIKIKELNLQQQINLCLNHSDSSSTLMEESNSIIKPKMKKKRKSEEI